MMKYLILFIATVLGIIALDAQAQKTPTETLISGEISHGGFGAPIYGFTSVNGELAYLRGIRGAWIINLSEIHSLNIGLGSYYTQSNFEPVRWQNQTIAEPEMETDYSGLELEYVNHTHRLFHFSVQMLMGLGIVSYDDEVNLDKTSDNYFALQPGANLNLNVTNWFRISGGLLYRFADGVSLEGTGDSDLSGFTSFASLRFGKF